MEKVRVAVDAMGGDYAPYAPVEGCLSALRKSCCLEIALLGNEPLIRTVLESSSYDRKSLKVIGCSEAIETSEPPAAAIRTKKDSSIVRGMKLLKDGDADAFVSAGNTGALLVGGQVIVGRLKGVERAPLGAFLPTEKGMCLLIDCGANVDARPSWLLQFAEIGSAYAENILKIKKPRVALVNIGAEEEKGSSLVRKTYSLLKDFSSVHFTGFVESGDISSGCADVIVTDAFTGNIILKEYEGVSKTIFRMLGKKIESCSGVGSSSSFYKNAIRQVSEVFDVSSYGGAPLLGLKGLVIKAHGNSSAQEICNSIIQCCSFHKDEVNLRICRRLAEEEEALRKLHPDL
ncbi:MAG TPA: phosphate acyltransferase PlsX [Lachnospiraceae bacterium]|nr:phosphate acyltransferase PlsX [Lachnospiraceae bacterium]